METLHLLKNSTSDQVKVYFTKVFELKESGEKYPVNLEAVWPLAYGRKQEAVRVLKTDFIENIDYQALRRNAQRGAAAPVDYFLTTECLEYFIAKRVKPVFEVYRQVFHQAVNQAKAQIQTEKQLAANATNAQLVQYFDRWLKNGDLKRIAIKSGANYATVRRVRHKPEISKRLANMIMAECKANQLAQVMPVHVNHNAVELLLKVDDKDVRLGLWNILCQNAAL
ncbi:MAG: hypothetical protein JW783_00430 [Bacteroidales bacterium]|nr:hypothetical protein [Bacteroidales bacterium]MBN2748487.1 hypothetical protein [Bacteroidales bacterium]